MIDLPLVIGREKKDARRNRYHYMRVYLVQPICHDDRAISREERAVRLVKSDHGPNHPIQFGAKEAAIHHSLQHLYIHSL